MVTEKALLQSFVGLAALVPVLTGLDGVLDGARLLGSVGIGGLDSHFPYLSGLLLGNRCCVHVDDPTHRIAGPALPSADGRRRNTWFRTTRGRGAYGHHRAPYVPCAGHGTGGYAGALPLGSTSSHSDLLWIAHDDAWSIPQIGACVTWNTWSAGVP
jgi:hypothetical protein